MRIATALITTFLLFASHSGGWGTFQAHRVSVRVPPGWYATARPLTLVTGPGVEDIAVASFPFPALPQPDGWEPAGTIARVQPAGAFIEVIDYGQPFGQESGFPPRSARIRLAHRVQGECFGPQPSYQISFSDAGRDFQIGVVFGRLATAATRALAAQVVNSFRVT